MVAGSGATHASRKPEGPLKFFTRTITQNIPSSLCFPYFLVERAEMFPGIMLSQKCLAKKNSHSSCDRWIIFVLNVASIPLSDTIYPRSDIWYAAFSFSVEDGFTHVRNNAVQISMNAKS